MYGAFGDRPCLACHDSRQPLTVLGDSLVAQHTSHRPIDQARLVRDDAGIIGADGGTSVHFRKPLLGV
jgi:hypothetical protein